MTGPPKVIIDTDAGLDDCMAIFMAIEAHQRKEIEIIGITTVEGNTKQKNVNVNVLRILDTAKLLESIPVFPGATLALVRQFIHTESYHGTDGFGDAQHPKRAPSTDRLQKKHGVNFIVEMVENYPGEVTIAALGPLTNLALAVRLSESFKTSLAGLYIMGGNIKGFGNISSCAEFNFCFDPEAAFVVLGEMKCSVKIAPWEPCLEAVSISHEKRIELGKSFNTPSAELLDRIEEKNIYEPVFNNYITCDQFAVAWMLHDFQVAAGVSEAKARPLVTEDLRFFATVELEGEHTRGQVVLDRRGTLKREPNVVFLKRVDEELYMEYIKKAFTV